MTPDLHIEIHEWDGFAGDRSVPNIPAGVARIWHWPLDASALEVADLKKVLSPDEMERAERYRFDQHRNEFILTRAVLRIVLASYTARSPESLSFDYSAEGKPALNNGPPDLRFNVSHTEGLAVLALVREREIGVDAEKIRPQPDAQKLAKRFFSAREQLFLGKLSGDELQRAFFRCWTRKEAYIKAKGEGLSIPLHAFDVSLEDDQPAALVGTRPDPTEAGRWTLYDLSVGRGYAAALTVANVPTTQPRA
jgi:4'-phosphopantetheinyl transferase